MPTVEMNNGRSNEKRIIIKNPIRSYRYHHSDYQ